MSVFEIRNGPDHAATIKKPKAVIFFGSKRCGHCQHMKEPFANLARNNPGITFAHVEVTEVPSANADLTPIFVAYKNGNVVDTVLGANMPGVEGLVRKINAGVGGARPAVKAPRAPRAEEAELEGAQVGGPQVGRAKSPARAALFDDADAGVGPPQRGRTQIKSQVPVRSPVKSRSPVKTPVKPKSPVKSPVKSKSPVKTLVKVKTVIKPKASIKPKTVIKPKSPIKIKTPIRTPIRTRSRGRPSNVRTDIDDDANAWK